MIVLEGLQNTTALVRSPSKGTAEMMNEHSRFSQTINDDLLRISSMPEMRNNVYRRFMIEDCFRIAALIYLSTVAKFAKDGQIESEPLLQHLRSKLIDTSTDWAHPVEMILRLLLGGGKVHSQESVYYVLLLMDISITLDWDCWKNIRDRLREYFLHAGICAGVHQSLWLCRLEIVEEL